MTRTDWCSCMNSSKDVSVRCFTFSAPSISAHRSVGEGGGGGADARGFRGSFMKVTKSASYSNRKNTQL